MKTNSPLLIAFIILAGFFAVAVGAGAFALRGVLVPEQSCTVGIVGSTALVHVSGRSADNACDQMVAMKLLGTMYQDHSGITGKELCRYTAKARMYTLYYRRSQLPAAKALCNRLAQNVPMITRPAGPLYFLRSLFGHFRRR